MLFKEVLYMDMYGFKSDPACLAYGGSAKDRIEPAAEPFSAEG